jgi:sugar phosphate isomerase/epimerase
MGEGCVDLVGIDRMMMEAGFEGKREVEIFSAKWWAKNQDEFLDEILNAYNEIY